MKKQLWLFVLFALTLSACSARKLPNNSSIDSNDTSSRPIKESSGAGEKTFANLEELRQFISKNHGISQAGGRGAMALDSAVTTGVLVKTLSAPQAGGAGSTDKKVLNYSQTNNQVKGVDEPDIVKTNGRLLFYANNNKIEIVKAYPATEAKLLKSLEFDGAISNIFIFNDKLVVYGTPNNFRPNNASSTNEAQPDAINSSGNFSVGKKMVSMPVWHGGNFTFLKIYNLNDPENPNLVTDLTFEGNSVDTRLINNYLYLITTKYSYNQNGGEIIPQLYQKNNPVVEKSFPPIHYFNLPYQTYSFTSVNAIDLAQDDSLPKREIYLLAGNENIYASADNLYITYTNYLNEQELLINKTREIIFDRLPKKDQDLIMQIDGLDEAILNKEEKSNKIYSLVMSYSSILTEAEQQQIGVQVKNSIRAEHPQLQDELISTVVQKIKLAGLTMTYQNQAQVPGRLLNQFSMDESKGYFRLATTRDQTWSQILDNRQIEPDNAVYVFDKDLKKVGSLQNLAPKERIYSARFLGDRAYLVTFVQTDPLFAIDLKNPADPKVLGELKVPGYSNYLHPINDNTLLGIGKEAATNEWGGVVPSNLKIVLFDVSDPSALKVLDEKTLGDTGSDSAALYDHKAFLYDDMSKILAIPINLMGSSKNQYGYAGPVFNGSAVFKISDSKLLELGKIDHNLMRSESANFDYSNGVRRNLIIENNLYTLSQNYLKINSLTNLEEIKTLEFNKQRTVPSAYPLLRNKKTLPVRIRTSIPIIKGEINNILP